MSDAQGTDKISAIAEMAVQCYTSRIFAVELLEWGYLSLTHSLSVMSDYNHHYHRHHHHHLFAKNTYNTAADPGGGSLGSDEPPSGRVCWLKTLELHGCIKVVQ